jgi:hypothetical protein
LSPYPLARRPPIQVLWEGKTSLLEAWHNANSRRSILGMDAWVYGVRVNLCINDQDKRSPSAVGAAPSSDLASGPPPPTSWNRVAFDVVALATIYHYATVLRDFLHPQWHRPFSGHLNAHPYHADH